MKVQEKLLKVLEKLLKVQEKNKSDHWNPLEIRTRITDILRSKRHLGPKGISLHKVQKDPKGISLVKVQKKNKSDLYNS